MVSRVMPGTTSLAGRTSTSTGSAAHIRSTARALAACRSRSADAADVVAISRRRPDHPVDHPVVDLVDEHLVMGEAAARAEGRTEPALLPLGGVDVFLGRGVPALEVSRRHLVEIVPGPRRRGEARPVDQAGPRR